MTAQDIALAIMAERRLRSFVLPTYTPRGWWECDVFERTQAGYFVEYEIKLSVSDFRADANKERETDQARREWGMRSAENRLRRERGEPEVPTPTERKHDLLARGDPRGPCKFFYVVPHTLVDKVQPLIPQWAGLMNCQPRAGHRPPYHCNVGTTIRAPRLHKQALGEKILQHADGVCYYRLHTAMIDMACVLRDQQIERENARLDRSKVLP